MAPLFFAAITVIGVCGLLFTAGRQTAPNALVTALSAELAQENRLVEALRRQSDAAENLAAERAKTLALYRKIFDSSLGDGYRLPERLGDDGG